jgi:hypothetical protein
MSIAISPFLRNALLADAAVSGAAGALMLFAGGFLAGLLDLPESLLRWAGGMLIPFVALLLLIAQRQMVARATVSAVIVLNILWVVASVFVLVGGLASPNMLGYVYVIAQAAAVALFAELQFIGLKRSSPVAA